MNEIKQQIFESIEHIDGGQAQELLLIPQRDPSFQNTQQGQLLSSYTPHLQIVAFPYIEDIVAQEVLHSHLLLFFQLGIPFDEKVKSRILIQGHYQKNKQRKLLKKAILENTEKVGGLAIGKWLRQFDMQYDPETRVVNDINNFLLSKSETDALNEQDRIIIKTILNTYDNLLSSTVVDIYDVLETQEQQQSGKQFIAHTPNEQGTDAQYRQSHRAPKEYKLEQALTLYPQINDQILTQTGLAIPNRQGLVTGTVKNWIYDYRSVLGGDKHSAMDRGNYLFNTKNTKELLSHERNVVAIVLKSLDDGTPLKIDVDTKQIIFDATVAAPQAVRPPAKQPAQKVVMPAPQQEKSNASFAMPPRVSTATPTEQTQTNDSVSGKVISTEDDMTFTSGHALPAEKEKLEQDAEQSSPYHMNPIGQTPQASAEISDKR